MFDDILNYPGKDGIVEECKACQGRGEDLYFATCPICKGTGEITIDKTADDLFRCLYIENLGIKRL
jgi:RecJ-like exonuclease